ncbi:MAG: hypothetical protein WC515_05060 [Candidatus Omnitrophota bacterium]
MVRTFVAAAVVSAALFCTALPASAATAEFQDFLKENPTVKICVEIKNSSGDEKVDANMLKKLIEEAFASRKSHNFIVVPAASEADLILRGDVTEYVWTENDPIDQVWGAGAAAMDAAMVEDYARIHVQSELISTKHNRVLWSDRVKATQTQKSMPKEASYEIVYQRFVKAIMIEIFRKRTTDRI